MCPIYRIHITLMPKGSDEDLGRFFLGRKGIRIKGDFSEEAAFKQALEGGQGFNRQRLGMQGRMLEAQDTEQRREVYGAPSGSPKWAGVAESGGGREDGLG